MNTAAIFDDLYASQPEAHASVRVGGRDVVSGALCSGLSFERQDTEQGAFPQTDIVLRLKSSAELSKGMDIGNRIEVKMDADTEWHTLRIRAKMATGGVMRYSLEAEYA